MFRYNTKVNSANANSRTKRTSIPKGIVELLDLADGDKIDWNVEVIDSKSFKIVVTKHED